MLTTMFAFVATIAANDGSPRVVGSRTVGHFDSPDLIEFAGKTFSVSEMEINTRSARTLSADSMREHLVKIEVPARVTLRELNEMVSSGTAHLPRKGWVKHVAKNTLAAYCNAATAEQIESMDGVSWVGEATDEHLRYMKTHEHVFNNVNHKNVNRDQLILKLHDSESFSELRNIIPSRIDVSVDNSIVVVECLEACREIADAVSAHHGLVHEIIHPTAARSKTKFSRGIMQSGESLDDSYAYLQGEGTVIAVADSGIDHDHCFFHDPNIPTPFNRIDQRHRKIVLYNTALVNGTDPDNSTEAASDYDPAGHGHGTHVAASIAGEHIDSGNELNEFKGIIPKAKIAFIDLSGQYDGEYLTIPVNMSRDMFGAAHAAGAFIHSNSWGSDFEVYDWYSRGFDEFMAGNIYDLVLASAGNEGTDMCEDEDGNDPKCDKFSLGTPGDCKNGVGVGASQSTMESYVAAGSGEYIIQFRAVNGSVVSFPAVRSLWGDPSDVLPFGKLGHASPAEACTNDTAIWEIDNPSDLFGRIAVIRRGICNFSTKVQGATDAGATAVIVASNRAGAPFSMGSGDVNPYDLEPNSYMVSEVAGDELLAAMAASPEMTAQILDVTDLNKTTENDLASFSSRGPTGDLRYKPDVIGVGQLVHSARSDSDLNTLNCDFAAMQGTSMSAPVTTATVGQIREWLLRNYPHFQSVPPTAALLKSVLVQSAVPITGFVDRNGQGDMVKLGEVPDFYQGHGRPLLASTLLVDELFFEDTNIFQSSGESKLFCLKVDTTTAAFKKYGFRATLVWTDPVAGPGSKWQLVNDLDLVVRDASGMSYLGNAIGVPKDHAKDSNNNVEKVRILNGVLQGDVVAVTVSSFSIIQPQQFAIVANGKLVDCPSFPQWNAEMKVITGSRTDEVLLDETETLQVWEWRYYRLPLEIARQLDTLSFDLEKTGSGIRENSSNPDVYLELGTPPTLRNHTSKWNITGGEYTISAGLSSDIIFGVMMGCCNDGPVRFTLSATWRSEPLITFSDSPVPLIFQESDDSSFPTSIIILLVILGIVGIMFGIVMGAKKFSSASSAHDEEKASFNEGPAVDNLVDEFELDCPPKGPNFRDLDHQPANL
eukprot:TRINITY_DN10543_c0_g1_i1.p1 TRINITY_DN10543_c0_g1~~TRINITY_DN10543_c0_g1_i1.p1  ORF type:complete len:1106 (+),score=202.71 TRINITY_DN10543_c0_g1_i1:77-3394(+)